MVSWAEEKSNIKEEGGVPPTTGHHYSEREREREREKVSESESPQGDVGCLFDSGG